MGVKMEDKRTTIEKVTSNPEDTELLAEFPSKQRKIHSDLINGRIVDSGTVQGLKPSNESGQIPINNGNLNKGLNAEKLGGEPKEYFSAATHRHNNVTNDVDGFMSKEDKRKLNTIKENAEENQNAFSGVAVANTITELTTSDNLITAKNKSDAFGLLGSENIKLDLDLSNNVTTIKLNGKVPTASYADNAKKAEKADVSTNAEHLENKPIYSSSNQSNSIPFIDENGVLNVGNAISFINKLTGEKTLFNVDGKGKVQLNGKSKGLGGGGGGIVCGDVSDPEAWWVKFGGAIPLIIQGGRRPTQGYGIHTWSLPIAFTTKILALVNTAVTTGGEGGSHFHFVIVEEFSGNNGHSTLTKVVYRTDEGSNRRSDIIAIGI